MVVKNGVKMIGLILMNYIDIYIRDEIKAHHIAVDGRFLLCWWKVQRTNLLDNMTEEDQNLMKNN